MENRKSRFLPLLAIILCMTMIVGATFALFTSKKKINIAVNAAEVDVQAYIIENSLKTYSLGVEQNPGDFELGGTAVLDATGDLKLNKVAPGDKVAFTIEMKNDSTIDVIYNLTWEATGYLADALKGYVAEGDGELAAMKLGTSDWYEWDVDDTTKTKILNVVIELPYETNDDYQGKDDATDDATITFTVNAYQGNMPLVDEWDGTASTTWLTETLKDNPQATEFKLDTAEDFAGFAALIDGTAPVTIDVDGEMVALDPTFKGKTVYLNGNVDLAMVDENGERVSFDPIGYGYNVYFSGTFDGQGYTISNLYQNGWDLGYDYSTEGGGLFASVKDATIKNVNIDNAEIAMECIDMGILVGYSYGECVYENITITNSTIANYERYTGGVVGEVNGKQTFKNVDVIDCTVVSMWGDFDTSVGGIIGGKWGAAEVLLEDCDVDCVLDVYNDVTSTYQWWAYRRAGMLIGNSEETATNENGATVASASYLTCVNCTVTYGDWVNYTYCEFAGTSWPFVRVQAGVRNSAYSNPRYGHPTDANGNQVVDDNHVHNAGEHHFEARTFDQLYGGGQGVYGNPAHEGVTVIYKNK